VIKQIFSDLRRGFSRRVDVMFEAHRANEGRFASLVGTLAVQIGDGLRLVEIVTRSDSGFLKTVRALDTHDGPFSEKTSYYALLRQNVAIEHEFVMMASPDSSTRRER
jgi:hypothetical protein